MITDNPHLKVTKLVPQVSKWLHRTNGRGIRRGEERFDSIGFFFQNTGFFVFAVVAGVVAIGFALLIEVKAHVEVLSFELRVHMKSRIACGREWTDKAHLVAVFVLKRVPGAAEQGHRVVGEVIDSEAHNGRITKRQGNFQVSVSNFQIIFNDQALDIQLIHCFNLPVYEIDH